MKSFKRIYVEITNCCNLKCSFCPTSKRDQRFMRLEEFEEIIKKIEGYGTYIYLHVKGEPLLHPDLEEILKRCYDYGLKVTITTNGTLLSNRENVLLKSKAVRQISVSLQSFEEIQNVKTFDTYLNQVLEVVKKGNQTTDILFELRLWNYDESNYKNSSQKNDQVLATIQEKLKLNSPIDIHAQKGKGIKLLPGVYLSKSEVFRWPSLSEEVVAIKGSCYGLRQQIAILVNGDVVPCCLDGEGAVCLGNIFESTFEEIITSNRFKSIVKGFEEGRLVEALCQRCGFRQRFQ